MKMDVTLALDADGRIAAVDNKILIDGGAYASFGLVTAYYAGQLLTGPYRFETYRFGQLTACTRTSHPAGPSAATARVQPRFAFEVALDEAAEKLGLDSRGGAGRRNFIGEFVETVNGQKITSNGFLKCLELVEKASGWKERHGKLGPGRGLGRAGVYHARPYRLPAKRCRAERSCFTARPLCGRVRRLAVHPISARA